jgi:hypothetical protein
MGTQEGVQREICRNQPENGSNLVYSPEYGYTMALGIQFLQRHPGDQWELYTYNEEGFRDQYSSGNESIIVLGDSFAEGVLASDDETYPYLLDRWNRNTAFENYGMKGYGTGNELLTYRNIHNETEHDLVILTFYAGNDMRNNVNPNNNPLKPNFTVQNGSLVLSRPPYEPNGSSETDQEPPTREGIYLILNHPTVNAGQKFLRGSTETYPFIWSGVRALGERTGTRYSPTPPTDDELQTRLRLTRHLVQEINRTQPASELLVLYIPERGEVNRDKPQRYRYEDGKPYWDAQRQMLKNVSANSSAVHYLDATPRLRSEHKAGNRMYGRINGHLDDQGYRTVAKLTDRWLRQRGFVNNTTDVDYAKQYSDDITTCP